MTPIEERLDYLPQYKPVDYEDEESDAEGSSYDQQDDAGDDSYENPDRDACRRMRSYSHDEDSDWPSLTLTMVNDHG